MTSYEAHQKKCKKMQSARLVDCPSCGLKVDRGEYSSHHSACVESMRGQPKPKKKSSKPSGGGDDEIAQLEAQLLALRQKRSVPADKLPKGAAQAGAEAGPEQLGDGDDHRIPCTICGRKFFEDRAAKHQLICAKNATRQKGKKKIKPKSGSVLRTKGTEFVEFTKCRAKVGAMCSSLVLVLGPHVCSRRRSARTAVARDSPVTCYPPLLHRHPRPSRVGGATITRGSIAASPKAATSSCSSGLAFPSQVCAPMWGAAAPGMSSTRWCGGCVRLVG